MKRIGALFIFGILGLFALVYPCAVNAQTSPYQGAGGVAAAESKIKTLEKRLSTLKKEKQALSRQRRNHLAELKDLGKQINKLKANKNRSILAEVKLKQLLPKHLEVSRLVERDERRIKQNQRYRLRIKNEILLAYDFLIVQTVSEMDKEQSRSRQLELVRRYFTLRQSAQKLRPSKKPDTDSGPFSIQLDPLDGPREIKIKTDRINDRIVKLLETIKQIDRMIAELRKEKALAEEMRSMIEERNLFEDGIKFAPSPRALPVRRPDDTGVSDPGGADGDIGEAGVHTSPLEVEGASGRSFMLSAIDQKIRSLETEKRFLENVIAGLQKTLKEFEQKAKDLSAGKLPWMGLTHILLPLKEG